MRILQVCALVSVCVLGPASSHAQVADSLSSAVDSLKAVEASLARQLEEVRRSLRAIEATRESALLLGGQPAISIQTTMVSAATVWAGPDSDSQSVGYVETGDSVVVRTEAVKASGLYWYVSSSAVEGWVLADAVNKHLELSQALAGLRRAQRLASQAAFREETERIHEEREKQQRARQAQLERQLLREFERKEKARREAILEEYGERVGGRIAAREVWIGMSAAMAHDSWGEPQRVNRTTTASGVSEQWVYHSQYLYFDNGVLTAIHTSE